MPITLAFTITSAIAIVLNGIFFLYMLRQRRRQQAEQKSGSHSAADNRRYRRIAIGFVLVWATILLEDAMMIGAGAGLLSGLRILGYLLAAVPLAQVVLGVFALRYLR